MQHTNQYHTSSYAQDQEHIIIACIIFPKISHTLVYLLIIISLIIIVISDNFWVHNNYYLIHCTIIVFMYPVHLYAKKYYKGKNTESNFLSRP